MTEAKISFTTKTRSGDLLTVRGDDAPEFRRHLAELAGNPETEKALSVLNEMALRIPAPYESGAQAVAQGLGAVPEPPSSYEPPWQDAAPPPAQQLPPSMNPSCENCGAPMRYEEWTGKNGRNAGRQFKAWKCTRDKDHKTQWVN